MYKKELNSINEKNKYFSLSYYDGVVYVHTQGVSSFLGGYKYIDYDENANYFIGSITNKPNEERSEVEFDTLFNLDTGDIYFGRRNGSFFVTNIDVEKNIFVINNGIIKSEPIGEEMYSSNILSCTNKPGTIILTKDKYNKVNVFDNNGNKIMTDVVEKDGTLIELKDKAVAGFLASVMITEKDSKKLLTEKGTLLEVEKNCDIIVDKIDDIFLIAKSNFKKCESYVIIYDNAKNKTYTFMLNANVANLIKDKKGNIGFGILFKENNQTYYEEYYLNEIPEEHIRAFEGNYIEKLCEKLSALSKKGQPGDN